MPRRRQAQSTSAPSPPAGPMVWLRADYEFPSTFSYRMPKASAQFAVGSPIPSPATVKLALVDTAIRWSGNIDEGRRIFELVKTARVCVVPPRRMVRFRAFIKRLKPPHSSAGPGAPTVESTGVRDYFLLDCPLSVFIEVPESDVDNISFLLQRIRRFGTSDSLCYCIGVMKDKPPAENLCARAFDGAVVATGGFVSLLADLTSESQFDGFNPFGGDQNLAKQEVRPWILPLTVKRSGETWAILERTGPNISKP